MSLQAIPLSPSFEDTLEAWARISPFIVKTPLTFSPHFSRLSGRDVYIKWESKQITGSFKERGALNFLLSHPNQGSVCAASAGNHALGLAYHASRLGRSCILVMPKTAPLVKIQRAEKYQAEVVLFGTTFDEAREYALELSQKRHLLFVPAFDHVSIVAGQASIGHEIAEQLPACDSVIVPVGGGGLISGIGIVLHRLLPEAFLLGVQCDWSTRKSYLTASMTPLSPRTLADGIAVKTLGFTTAPLVAQFVHKMTSVSEEEISDSIMQFLEYERSVVEGSGGVGLSALLRKELPHDKKKVVLVMSGGNIDLNVLSRLIEREMAQRSQVLKCVISVPDRPGCLHSIVGVIAEHRANILEILHDRSFSKIPGNVSITVVLEIRDSKHGELIVNALQLLGATIEVQRA